MSTTMLYKEGKSALIWRDIPCDFIIVNDSEVEEKLSEGWKKSPFDLYMEDKPQDKPTKGRKPKVD